MTAVAAAGTVSAAGTPAGTAIQNSAHVTYDVGGTPVTASSNLSTLTVAEVVNVNVTAQTPTVTVAPGAANSVVVMRVTNTGNGQETFRLTGNSALTGDNFDPTPATNMLYFDVDGNGVLSAADVIYVPGTNDPTLNPDAFVTILVVNNIPTGLANGQTGLTQLTAASRTGTGAPGTVFAGQGTSGVDAVLGVSGGTAAASASYVVAAMQINAVKSQTIADQFGGTQPIPGARITYQIVVTPTGTGTANNVVFNDNIPTNTTYLAGSLKINGTAQTDAADADAGAYVTTPSPYVTAGLGNLTQASGAQTITFTVTIN